MVSESSMNDRFTMVVIGRIRAGRQDFRSLVGMGSRGQVALDEEDIALVISSMVAGEKRFSCGGIYEVEYLKKKCWRIYWE